MDRMLSRRTALKLIGAAMARAMLEDNASASTESIAVRKIPKSGEALPCIGLGTYQAFDVSAAEELQQASDVLAELVNLGGRVVDSSPMYGRAETVIGDILAQRNLGKRLFLATKVWTSGRDEGMAQARQSMERMKTAKLDLLQVHNLLDADTHLKWLEDWKQRGLVRYVGVTHYSESAYESLEKYVRSPKLDFVQLNYSIAEREAERKLLPAAASSGVAVIVNRPFAQASLFDRVKGRALPDWAAEFDARSWAQFFLKYILGHPAVTCAIPATRSLKHLADNMQAGRGRLPDEKMRQRMGTYFSSL